MGEDDEILSATQKWSLQSSSATSLSSDALLEQSSNCNISQDVSLHHHTMSSGVPALSTSKATPTMSANLDHDSNIPSNSHTNIEQSLVPSYINNPSVWAPLSTNDFIGDPSVIAAAMSGTSDIVDRSVKYEVTALSVPEKTEEDVQKKQLVATSKEFVPLKKNETSSSKLSPTASSFDYSSVPMPPPLPTSSLNISLSKPTYFIRGDAAGIYQQATTLYDETNIYYKEGIWDGQSVTFVIFRTSLYQPTKKYWLLGIAGSIILFVNKAKKAHGARKHNRSSWKLFDTNECYNLTGKLYPMLTPQLNTKDRAANPSSTALSTPPPLTYAHPKSYKKVKVIGCGVSNINGLYKKSYNRNGFTSYIKSDIEWNGIPGNFILLRDAFYWSIGFQLQKERVSKTFYRTNVSLTKSDIDHPPCDGWITVGTGVEPAPTFQIGWYDQGVFCPSNEKTPSPSSKDTVPTKTSPDESKEEEEVQSKKQSLVATSQEFVPQKDEVVVASSSKLLPTASLFDYQGVQCQHKSYDYEQNYQSRFSRCTPNPDLHSKTVKVSRCGISNVNGLYNRSYDRNRYPSYIKHKIKWNGTPGNSVLHRNRSYWYIEFQDMISGKLVGRKKAFYRARVLPPNNDKDSNPPCGGWFTSLTDMKPPPTLEIGWFNCFTRKYTK